MKYINKFKEIGEDPLNEANKFTKLGNGDIYMTIDGYRVFFMLLGVSNNFGDLYVFTPKTSADLDVIDEYSGDVVKDILKVLNKQFKGVEFEHVPDSPAAGYSFKVDQNHLLNNIK